MAAKATSIYTIAIIAVLSAAAVYWLWFGLTQRIFPEDDVLSISTSLSILENGLPQRETGHLYHRGYVPNYLVAGSIGIFGTNDFAIMLPSLLMGLGILWLV